MAKENSLSRLLADKAPPEKIVEHAYLSALSRYPTKRERERILRLLRPANETDLRPRVEDMYWALLSSKEFLFNH